MISKGMKNEQPKHYPEESSIKKYHQDEIKNQNPKAGFEKF